MQQGDSRVAEVKEEIFCAFCSQSITKNSPKTRRRKVYKRPFCSSVCWGLYQKQENDSKRQKKVCVQCGDPISLREKNGSLSKIKSWIDRKYCSRKCTNTGRALLRAQGDEHFWSFVDIGKNDECWNWKGLFFKHFLKSGAYGRYNNVAYKTRRAHRIAYIKSHGPIADNLVVRHDCDNPACCNPNHLKPGTHQDNSNDMLERQRSRPPARDLRPGTIIKQKQLQEIWADYVVLRKSNGGRRIETGKYKALEVKHSVSAKTIRQLINCAIVKIDKEHRKVLFAKDAPAPD